MLLLLLKIACFLSFALHFSQCSGTADGKFQCYADCNTNLIVCMMSVNGKEGVGHCSESKTTCVKKCSAKYGTHSSPQWTKRYVIGTNKRGAWWCTQKCRTQLLHCSKSRNYRICMRGFQECNNGCRSRIW